MREFIAQCAEDDSRNHKLTNIEIIRCGECKYWWSETALCTHPDSRDGDICCLECKDDDFCSKGVRK